MNEHTTPKPKRPGCTCSAGGSPEGCYHHDPKNAAKRRRTAQRAARSKAGGKEARAVRELMDHLTEQVLTGDLEPAILYAAVAAQNTKLRAIEVERRLEEADVRAELEGFKELLREHGIVD